MPTTQTQLRRGTSTQNLAMTPAEGEVIVDMTNDRLSLGDGLTAGGIPQASAADVRGQKFTYITVAGTDTLTATGVYPSPGSYSEGQTYQFKPVNDNTGAVTLNINAIGAVSVRKNVSGTLTVLSAGDLKAGVIYSVMHTGTYFQIMNAAVAAPAPSGLVLLGTSTGSGSGFEFNGLFSSAYSSYKLVMDNIKTASSGVSVRLEFRNSGSYVTSGYVGSDGINSNLIWSSVNATQGVSGSADIFLNNNLNPRARLEVDAGNGVVANSASGFIRLNQNITCDGVRVLFSSGTASGRVTLYGLAL